VIALAALVRAAGRRSRLGPIAPVLLTVVSIGCSKGAGGIPASSTDEPIAVERLAGRAVGALRPAAAFALAPELHVDLYGARQTGPYLAFGLARGSGPTVDRTASHELAVIDTRRATMVARTAVTPGATVAAIAGTGGWLITRERKPEDPAGCAGDIDCISWALYAFRLPSLEPLLLSRSERPESQTHAPEPRDDGETFAWMEGSGPESERLVKAWRPGDATPRLLGQAPNASASPFLSVAAGEVWLDERRPDGTPPVVRRLAFDGRPRATIEPGKLIFFPQVAGGRIAFVEPDHALALDDPSQQRSLVVGRIDAGRLEQERRLAMLPDVADLAWIDDTRLAVVSEDGVDVFDVGTKTGRVAHLGARLVCAARAGNGHLVVVSNDGAGRDVVQSLTP